MEYKEDMKMKTIKHDTTYNEAIEKADIDFHSEDGQGMTHKCPYLFTSNMADAYWLTAHVLYYFGRRPVALHKSRGNKWLIDIKGAGEFKVEVLRPDHRSGIKGIVSSYV
jgi:hypothetical protein